MCPHCRQNAPIVYRGVNAFCTACGGPRMPLASESVNMAGQTSKVGGTLARVFGWLVLAGGTLVALSFAAIFLLISSGGAAGYVVGAVLEAVTLALTVALLRGGRKLKEEGVGAEKGMRAKAIFALANTRRGMLTPMDVAQSINVTPQEGDAILTDLAKTYPDHVTVDVDDNGTIYYRFSQAHWNAIAANAARVRVDAPQPVRVAPAQQGGGAVAEAEELSSDAGRAEQQRSVR